MDLLDQTVPAVDRPQRLRASAAVRRLVRETRLSSYVNPAVYLSTVIRPVRTCPAADRRYMYIPLGAVRASQFTS